KISYSMEGTPPIRIVHFVFAKPKCYSIYKSSIVGEPIKAHGDHTEKHFHRFPGGYSARTKRTELSFPRTERFRYQCEAGAALGGNTSRWTTVRRYRSLWSMDGRIRSTLLKS